MNDFEKQREEATPSQSARPQSPFSFIGLIIFWLALAVTLITLFASHWWLADLLTHFRVQMVIGMALAIFIFAVSRRWKFLVASIALVTFLIAPMVGYVQPAPSAGLPVLADTYRLMTCNVLTSNTKYDEMVEFIRDQEPDFVVLLEVDSAWMEKMNELESEYPYMNFKVREDNFGIALMSRFEWKECTIRGMGLDRLPAIMANFELESIAPEASPRRLQIMGVHPIPPMRSHTAERRNTYLVDACANLKKHDAHLMTGDFNLSPWSPWFARINRLGNTRDAALNMGLRGLTPTWHTFPTVLGGIKIDHALVSPEIEVRNYRVSKDLGSDHRAILIDFGFRVMDE